MELVISIGIAGILLVAVVVLVYVYMCKDKSEYKKARVEIFAYVKGHKTNCTGLNRFVVTVPILQDIFREYDTEVINKVWLDLVNERVIEKDSNDNEWCIR